MTYNNNTAPPALPGRLIMSDGPCNNLPEYFQNNLYDTIERILAVSITGELLIIREKLVDQRGATGVMCVRKETISHHC